MRILGTALAIALSFVLVAIIFAVLGLYIAIAALSLAVCGICWFLADVLFAGNRKYGLRVLDPVFGYIEDHIIFPVTGVAIIPLALPVEAWKEFARNGYKITLRKGGGGPGDNPPNSAPSGTGPREPNAPQASGHILTLSAQ